MIDEVGRAHVTKLVFHFFQCRVSLLVNLAVQAIIFLVQRKIVARSTSCMVLPVEAVNEKRS